MSKESIDFESLLHRAKDAIYHHGQAPTLEEFEAALSALSSGVSATDTPLPAGESHAGAGAAAAELLRIWQTWLGPSRDSCDEEGKKLWDRISEATEGLHASDEAIREMENDFIVIRDLELPRLEAEVMKSVEPMKTEIRNLRSQLAEAEARQADCLRAIHFARSQGISADVFLDAWAHGDLEEWPEFGEIQAPKTV